MAITVTKIERWHRCGCDGCGASQDRQCPHCAAPFEAGRGDELWHCPRCGCPTTAAHRADRATTRELRRDWGLIP